MVSDNDSSARDSIKELRSLVNARLSMVNATKANLLAFTVVTVLIAVGLASTSASLVGNLPLATCVTTVLVIAVSIFAEPRNVERWKRTRPWTLRGEGRQAKENSPQQSAQEFIERFPEVWSSWSELREKIINDYVTSLWYESMTDDLDVPNALREILDNAFIELSRRARAMNLVNFALREIPDVLAETLEAYRSARSEIGEENLRKMTTEDAELVLNDTLVKREELHPVVSGAVMTNQTTHALRQLATVMTEILLDEKFASPLTSSLVRELLVISLLQPLLGFAKPHWANRGILYLTGKEVDYEDEDRNLEIDPDTVAHESEETPTSVSGEMHSRSMSTSSADASSELFSDFNLSAQITSAEIVGSGGSAYAVYLVTVSTSENETWVVPRRFRNFETLHRRLRDVDKSVASLNFPSKGWIKQSLSASFIENRRVLLNAYLRAVLENKTVARSKELFAFMDARPGIYDPDQRSQPMPTSDLFRTMSEAVEGVTTIVSNSAADLMNSSAQLNNGEAPLVEGKSKRPPKHKRISVTFYSESDSAKSTTTAQFGNDGIDKSPSTRDMDRVFQAEGEEDTEDELMADIEGFMDGPVLDLFECVFSLKSKPMMRRALVKLVRQTLEFFFSIERSVSNRVRDFRSTSSMARTLAWLRRVVWPEVPYPPDTPKRLTREGETARSALVTVFTNQNVQTIMGTRASSRAAHEVFSLLQSQTCVRHIGFVILESLAVALFPEILARAAEHELVIDRGD